MRADKLFNFAGRHRTIWGIGLFLCLVGAGTAFSGDAPSETLDSMYVDEIDMIKGELVTVKVYSMTRVSVTDPGVADIADADDKEILLVGKSAGQTALFIWDEHGKRVVMVYVFNQDLDLVKKRIEKLFKDVDIHEVKLEANEREGKVVVSGEVPAYKREQFDSVIEKFGDDVINLVKDEKIEDLVQIDMQITEMSTTVSHNLGIEWSTGTQTLSGSTLTTTSSGSLNPVYGEIFPSIEPGLGDYLKIGQFRRTNNSALLAKINALAEEGKARILSKPKLVVVSGEEASFLVGGEVPIRTTTFATTGASQENVEFKEYGVSMTLTPTIKTEKVDIVMNLEISDIDASTASTISDTVAFSTRSASTHLYLDDAQTIILAGLIKHATSETLKKVPFLGDIPILGLLFRNRSNSVVPDTDLDLVIALTPHILRQRNIAEAGKTSADKGTMGAPRAPGAGRLSSQKAVPYYLGIPKEMTGYVRDVQQKISRAIVYPPEAEQYGWEGTVKLGMLILKDGTLAFALVKESSGRDIFDEVALNTARNAAPFLAFPSDTDLQELSVTIPIVYSLNKN